MKEILFDGRNIIANSEDGVTKGINILNAKADLGEFKMWN